MNKTTEIIALLQDSANRAFENGHKLIGRSEGIRDVINFIKNNGLEIVDPREIKAEASQPPEENK